jgi:hypothetical protein
LGCCQRPASAGLTAVGRYKVFGLVPVGAIFNASLTIGDRSRQRRTRGRGDTRTDAKPATAERVIPLRNAGMPARD